MTTSIIETYCLSLGTFLKNPKNLHLQNKVTRLSKALSCAAHVGEVKTALLLANASRSNETFPPVDALSQMIQSWLKHIALMEELQLASADCLHKLTPCIDIKPLIDLLKTLSADKNTLLSLSAQSMFQAILNPDFDASLKKLASLPAKKFKLDSKNGSFTSSVVLDFIDETMEEKLHVYEHCQQLISRVTDEIHHQVTPDKQLDLLNTLLQSSMGIYLNLYLSQEPPATCTIL